MREAIDPQWVRLRKAARHTVVRKNNAEGSGTAVKVIDWSEKPWLNELPPVPPLSPIEKVPGPMRPKKEDSTKSKPNRLKPESESPPNTVLPFGPICLKKVLKDAEGPSTEMVLKYSTS